MSNLLLDLENTRQRLSTEIGYVLATIKPTKANTHEINDLLNSLELVNSDLGNVWVLAGVEEKLNKKYLETIIKVRHIKI